MSVQKHYVTNKRYGSVGDSAIWMEVIAMAKKYSKLNLGHGFPGMLSPTFYDKIQEVLDEKEIGMHQYARSPGHLKLVNTIAQVYSSYFDREIDPLNEVLISVGGDGALHNVIASITDEGDEIIVIEPFYEPYLAMIQIAGGVAKFVTLKPPKMADGQMSTLSSEWTWDENELESAFTSKTKAIIVNSPNNPLGKVLTIKELERIADLCIKHNTLCISDEVYQHITYESEHFRIAKLPGMWERTVTIGSAGKVIGTTGSKVGYSIGPSELISRNSMVQYNSIYCCPTFFQEVTARCFDYEFSQLRDPATSETCYLKEMPEMLRQKRDRFAKYLMDAGLKPVIPQGSFFMLADISEMAEKVLDKSDNNSKSKDIRIVKYLLKEKGLATIPISIFYSEQNKMFAENFIRFNYFKDDETLDKAAVILSELKQ